MSATAPRSPRRRHSQAMPGRDDRVSIRTFVDIVAPLIRGKDDTLRNAKSKLRKMIVYAIERGNLIASADGRLTFGDAIAWARRKKDWRDDLHDLPSNDSVVGAPPAGSLVTTGFAPRVYTSDQCPRLLREAYERLDDLERLLAEANVELDRLRPIAERHQKVAEKNRQSAKLPRKGK